MKKFNRFIALLLCAGLIFSSAPLKARAETTTKYLDTVSYVNPLYGDTVGERPVALYASSEPAELSADEYFTDFASAGDHVRPLLKERQGTITVGFKTTSADHEACMKAIMNEAMSHTGVPDEGDYILWTYGGWNCDGSVYVSGGYNFYTFTYTVSYHTTAAQEDEVDMRVDELLEDFDVYDESDYTKIRTVYDYLCENITYDYTSTGSMKHTAYNGLMKGTCVCQGYAILMYRFALELDVDCRLISGKSFGQDHGWNIVKLGDLYYNLDSTWDAGQSSYSYFLKGPDFWDDHTRGENYTTDSFTAKYPVASGDFISCQGSSDASLHCFDRVTVAPSCTEPGSETEVCTVCGVTWSTTVVPAAGHTQGEAVKENIVEAGCESEGSCDTVAYCIECGKELYRVAAKIPAAGHDYVEGTCTRCGDTVSYVEPTTVKSANVASSGKIKLTWTAVENAEKYVVYRSTTKNGVYTKMFTTSKTSYTNTSAEPGEYYYYYVIAIAADGTKSEKSNIAGRTCDYARPVIKISNVASTGKVRLTWAEVEGATSYKVYRAASKDGKYTLMKKVTGTSYTNTSAAAGKTYYYKVKAYGPNSNATSAYSEIKSRTCDLPRPTVSITRSSGKPKLSWKAVSGAKEYKIYRATSKNGTYKAVKTTTSKSWKDTTAKKGKTYYYKVVAVHSRSSANSAYSSYKYIKCTK